MRRDGDSVVRIEFCTRANSAVPDRRETIIEWLDRLETKGAIDEYSHVTWPAEVELDVGHETLDLFASFEAWGEYADAELRPPFQVRTHRSLLAEPERDVLVTPELGLAAYEDDELVAVRPCHRGGKFETIDEYLSSLVLSGRTTADSSSLEAQNR